MDYLVFRLYGPMASWGATAVGEVRPTHVLPTRSAILGLLAAALGIRRDQQARLDALSESVDVAIRAPGRGALIRDYHTAQMPSTEKKAIWTNRKAELENSRKINTVLSTRDYWGDSQWIVALNQRTGATVGLDELEAALVSPRFPLYLGRRSCPLAAPLSPRRIDADGLKSALYEDWAPLTPNADIEMRWKGLEEIQWESSDPTLTATETIEQWDQPGSRARWQFGKRTVYTMRLSREE